jgi:heat shock protein HslJ
MTCSVLVAIVVVSAVLSACTEPSDETNPNAARESGAMPAPATYDGLSGFGLAGTSWTLSRIDDRSVKGSQATLEFTERRLGGSTGCNSYGGVWEPVGDRIRVGRIASTLIACSGRAAWVDGRLLALLSGSPVVRVDPHVLRLSSDDGELMFERASPAGG